MRRLPVSTIACLAMVIFYAVPASAQSEASGMASPVTTVVPPDNSAPELDARGIPVMSSEATVPAGWNQAVQAGPLAMPTGTPTMGSATDAPRCTRSLTDRCLQFYERRIRLQIPKCPEHPDCPRKRPRTGFRR
jgi:hypothetical protein